MPLRKKSPKTPSTATVSKKEESENQGSEENESGEESPPIILTAHDLDPDDDWEVPTTLDSKKEKKNKEKINLDESKKEKEETIDEEEEEEDESIKMLYVLVHGENGNPSDWNNIRRELYNRFNSSILIMTSSSNSQSTNEGIEVGGRNLTCEIAGFINQAFQVGPRTLAKQRYKLFVKSDRFGVSNEKQPFDSLYAPPNLNKIHSEDTEAEKDLYMINLSRIASGCVENGSKTIPITLIGFSLGGLYVRNAIGWLYFYGFFPTMEVDSVSGSDTRTLKNPFPVLKPMGVFTICTPNLGSRRPSGWMKSTWKSVVHSVMSSSNGQTGVELTLEDHTNKSNNKNSSRIQSTTQCKGKPLLWAMTLLDSIYMRGLRMFEHRTMVGITHHDKLVSYCSAVVVGHNPYPAPSSKTNFIVVGSFGFTQEHNLVIIPYHDLNSFSVPRPSELPADDPEVQGIFSTGDAPLPVNTQPSASIIGIPKAPGSPYYTDTNIEVEYHSEMLTNLQSLSWRFVIFLLFILFYIFFLFT